jgi:uncharacterized protein
MKLTLFALLFTLVSCQQPAEQTAEKPDYPFQPVAFTDVQLTDSFWAPRIETNRRITIPVCFRRCEETGRIDNFKKAAGRVEGEFEGLRYDDSDVFKVIEGAAYSLAVHPDPELESYLDELIDNIAAAQEDDGYILALRTVGAGGDLDRIGEERWSHLIESHELYNSGHLFEAAVAHYQATGKRTLLDVAIKSADLICDTFGADGIRDVPGHEEIEMGLVKLYRTTGNERYLTTAHFFVDERGNPERKTMEDDGRERWYSQDHLPVREQSQARGHAVRAGYFYAGATDLAALTGDPGYGEAIDRIWHSVVDRRMYITGGVGSTSHGEAFGEDYVLPNATAYAETCAAIANALWNHRLFLLHGDGKYIDVLERVLYNGFLSGVSLSGDLFFYENPLAADGETKFNKDKATRAEWFRTSCCPVNVSRLLPSVPGYVYAVRDEELYVNLYAAGEAKVTLPDGRGVRVVQETEYPWDGQVRITVEPERSGEFAVKVRIPGWARNEPVPSDLYRYQGEAGTVSLDVNGEVVDVVPDKGYVTIQRAWNTGDVISLNLPMEVRRAVAHEAVEENTSRVALERGPVVYCVEGADNGGSVDKITVEPEADLAVEHRGDLLGGVTLISGPGFVAVPYYAWSNRGEGPMAVWLKTAN